MRLTAGRAHVLAQVLGLGNRSELLFDLPLPLEAGGREPADWRLRLRGCVG
jgi:hypothetical protein